MRGQGSPGLDFPGDARRIARASWAWMPVGQATAYEEADVTKHARNRNEFGRTSREVMAKIVREGRTRVERERVERLGEALRYRP